MTAFQQFRPSSSRASAPPSERKRSAPKLARWPVTACFVALLSGLWGCGSNNPSHGGQSIGGSAGADNGGASGMPNSSDAGGDASLTNSTSTGGTNNSSNGTAGGASGGSTSASHGGQGTIGHTCVPQTCTELKATCGLIDDGCGKLLSCGICAKGQVCARSTNTCGASGEDTAGFRWSGECGQQLGLLANNSACTWCGSS